MEKVFILGVGAQKAGTSWLHQQLNRNNNIDMGFCKEYHVFDAIEEMGRRQADGTLINGFRNKAIKKVMLLHEQGKLGVNQGARRNQNLKYAALRLSFIDNADTYFDYFDYLFLKNKAVKAVGDITPNYALLQANTFDLIKKGLEKRGFKVKVIFLMRDPVERAWSFARMRKKGIKEERRNSFNEFNFLLKNDPEHQAVQKSNYEKTIKNLEVVFDSADIYYGFYEKLFTPQSFQDIQKFLNISLEPFNASSIINASPKQDSLPKEINHKLALRHQATYEFMLHRYGQSLLKLWQGYQELPLA